MKTLIIFSFVVLISFSNSQSLSSTTNFKCPDDKIKIGNDVCAIESSKDGTTDVPNVVYVKKKSCGKNKYCDLEYDGSSSSYYNRDTKQEIITAGGSRYDIIYTCQKKVKLLKIKKKCNYHAECKTGFCNGGKCAAYGDLDCHGDSDSCGPGKFCKQTGTSGTYTYECTDYVKEGGSCLNNAICAPGLEWLFSSDQTTCTCTKLFSLENGKETRGDYFCKSAYSIGGKCAEIVSVDGETCEVTYNDGNNKGTDKTNNIEYKSDTTTKKYCKIKNGIKEVISDLVERYNKIKFDKLLEKEDCDYAGYYCDKKFAELFAVYSSYGKLLYHGIIKENGKKDKKCEYEFWRTVSVSSSYINICLGFAFALLSLLF